MLAGFSTRFGYLSRRFARNNYFHFSTMEKALSFNSYPFLSALGLEETNPGCYHSGKWMAGSESLLSYNPHNNAPTARVNLATNDQYEDCIRAMESERDKWMLTPAPVRGEIVRLIGEELRKHKGELGSLIALEMGKIKVEGDGEVQEFIDTCDLACGLSRTMEGKVLPSERPGHFMLEQWNPLGLIGIITAFNFPCAPLGWNAAIALVCGDLMMWKGAPSTPLTSIAVTKIISRVLDRHGFSSVFTLC